MLNVNVKGAGGDVRAIIFVGHNQVNTHRMFRWEPDLTNPLPLPKDNSGSYFVGNAAMLDQRVISWEVRVAASTPSTPETYSVTVFLTQDGQTQQIEQLIETMTLGVQVNGSARIRLV